MTIQVNFGAAQTGVGFRFYAASGAWLGARVTSGILAGPVAGLYLSDVSVPAGAVGVYWSCDASGVYASEDLSWVIKIESVLDAAAAINSRLPTHPAAREDVQISVNPEVQVSGAFARGVGTALPLSAYLRTDNLTDVGYRFYDGNEQPLGARSTTGVINAGDGWYTADVPVPAMAMSIRWDSLLVPAARAREYFPSPGNGTIGINPPLADDTGELTIYRGASYAASEGRAIAFSYSNAPILTGSTPTLCLGNARLPGTVTDPASVQFELTKEQTGSLSQSGGVYEVRVTLTNGHVLVLGEGQYQVKRLPAGGPGCAS